MNLVIEKLSTIDCQALTDLERHSHQSGWSEANIRSALNSPHQIGYGGWLGANLVGYMVVMPQVADWELLNIVVAKQNQQAGIGGKLIEFLIERARQSSAQRILLELRASNHAAQNLYKRFGFQVIATRADYYIRGDSKEDAIIMQLAL
ncbi:ribosomal protein S18-alanine N-acetyltransferase [Aliikangiella sp. IMCC44632]